MLSKILSLFIIFSFVFTVVGADELSLLDSKHEHSVSMIDQVEILTVSILEKPHCDDCPDCCEKGHCCQGFCHCVSSFLIESKKNISFSISLILSKTDWLSRTKYHSPFIDQALKPPLFS